MLFIDMNTNNVAVGISIVCSVTCMPRQQPAPYVTDSLGRGLAYGEPILDETTSRWTD